LNTTKPENLLELGRVIDAYGLKGWIKVNPSSSDSVLVKLKTWWLEQPEGNFRSVVVSKPRLHGSTVVALPLGFEDRNQAEALKGAKVWADRSGFPPPTTDEFYWVDLVGCDVFDPDGQSLGRVIGLQDHGAHPILEIQDSVVAKSEASPNGKLTQEETASSGPNAAKKLLPFVSSIVSKVDIAARQIHVEWRADFFD
jgi:16S rRNA processing protein RimM